MTRKLLSFLAAVGAVAAVAWFVQVTIRPRPLPDIEKDKTLSGSRIPSRFPEEYRATVESGLDFLIKNQHDDGHWAGDDASRPVAITGLAGLAMLMHDSNRQLRKSPFDDPNPVVLPPAPTKYSAIIAKAADWLASNSQPERGGLIFSAHPSEAGDYMRSHGLATIFLAGVCQLENDEARAKKLRSVLGRAVQYIEKSQSTRGGWFETSKLEGHDFDAILPTAIQLQALDAAQNAFVPVRNETVVDAKAYLMEWLERKTKDASTPSDQKHAPLVDVAAALTCRTRPGNYGGPHLSSPLLDSWRKKFPIAADRTLGRDEMLHYYIAQALFNNDWGEPFITYRTATFEHLKSSQNPNGSWPVGAGPVIGSVEAAAIWCTVMQLDHDQHPSKNRSTIVIMTRNLLRTEGLAVRS